MDKIRVMVADDDKELAGLLVNVLNATPDFEVVAQASNGTEALELVSKVKPEMLLCDVNMPGVDGIEVTRQVTTGMPDTIVVVISGEDYNEFSKKAVAVGAKDYISKPFQIDSLAEKLKGVFKATQDAKAAVLARKKGGTGKVAKLIAFWGAKGSPGVTQLAINFSIELVRCQQKVLLVDLNLHFGDIEFLLDAKKHTSISELVLDSGDMATYGMLATIDTHESGLKMVYQHELESADKVGVAQLVPLLEAMSAQNDFLTVDVNRALEDRTLAVLDAADIIFAVATPDYLVTKNMKSASDLFKRLGYGPDKLKVILNKAPSSVPAHVIKFLGEPYATLPYDPTLFEQAVKDGFPPIVQAPGSAYSKAIQALVKQSLSLTNAGKEAQPERPKGIGGVLKSLFG